MNAFEKHGINHLSASSLNAWAAQPACWLMERLLKLSAPVGAAAHRGSAVEFGVTEGLIDPTKPVADCQAAAVRQFDALTAMSADPNRDKEREAVAPTVAVALAELRQYGVPDLIQTRIERTLPDVPVPLIGFLDYGWTAHGMIVDLKTSLRLASEISDAHARQVAGYVSGPINGTGVGDAAGAGAVFAGRIAYATPKKIGVYALENPEIYMTAMQQIAVRLGRFLAISNDPRELAGLLTPDFSMYHWSNPVAREHGRQVYGF